MAESRKQDIPLGITRFEYGEQDRKRVAVLQIETGKYYNGGLISDAGVYWVGNGSRQSCISLYGGGGDYGKRLKVSDRDIRATQKAIDKQHAEVFTAEVVAALIESAKLHYSSFIRSGRDGYGNTYEPNIEAAA